MTKNKELSRLEKVLKGKKLTDDQIRAIADTIRNPSETASIKKYSHRWASKHVKIGLGSDLHIGSKYIDQFMIDDVFKRWKKEGK